MQNLYGEELKARLTVPKLEDSPVATFRECSCNISLFTATIRTVPGGRLLYPQHDVYRHGGRTGYDQFILDLSSNTQQDISLLSWLYRLLNGKRNCG
jgi:hypothetical protein